jgi:hypothetical protein
VAEVLVQFSDPVISGGVAYLAKACGAPTADGRWQGWIEFTPLDGGPSLRSRRETTQPNRVDAVYWATGLTAVYLEGALQRTLKPPIRAAPLVDVAPVFDAPAPEPIAAPAPAEAILDPFSVYRKGEERLQRQLAALAPWHLINIIQAYRLSDLAAQELNALTGPVLIEIILDGVRESAASGLRM